MILGGTVVVLVLAVGGTEIGLRSLLGFGKPLLYIADPQIGYLLAPNQQTRRFGNEIGINQYSMRSGAITAHCPAQTFRVLLLGDSIANGGWWTDQRHTISALLQERLAGSEIAEVLNASANSWGPRNELAYLQRFGSFESKIVVLLINTDDLFAVAPTSIPVGRDRNYPNQQPASAISEALSRYAMKAQPIPELAAWQKEEGDRVGINLEAIRQIQTFVAQHQGQLLLAMTPLLREVGTPGSRDYETKARQRLEDFTKNAAIPFIDFLPQFNEMGNAETLYHDHIHFNFRGNQEIARTLNQSIQAMRQ
ncbi:MAG: SGNH/GDSL hydrolase family protein [Timaviella obliquedivisa GSE-PSE-MK23-08B]|jgi:lysophospholipase L1-like esterase|nr:SGNH/GDSL hydrolase family protein [Timaviella obliquedivisa GSE-PSE-MK23-08B]